MKILMVCLGNICRSPLAQGILEKKIDELGLDWKVDSAGTSGWHEGEGPDRRSIQVAQDNGISIHRQISRKFLSQDLEDFDVIFAMDSQNYRDIVSLAESTAHKSKVQLILNHLFPGQNMAVPDPYYDGGFENVFDLLERAIDQFVKSKIK